MGGQEAKGNEQDQKADKDPKLSCYFHSWQTVAICRL